jgi:hypothetical protein
VIGEYFDEVNAFRDWLFQWLREIHAGAVRRGRPIRAELEALGRSRDPWLS